MANAPSIDIAQLLEDEGVGTQGVDIFASYMPEGSQGSPTGTDLVVSVYDIGGLTALNVWQWEEMLVSFNIRGNPGRYQEGYALATAVKEALIGHDKVTINGTDYFAFNIIGNVRSLGPDTNNRPLFSLDLRVTRVNGFTNSSRDPF